MKKEILIRHVTRHGCILIRQKGSHAYYQNPSTGAWTVIPIHNNIKENLAYAICKQLGIPKVSNN